MSDFLVTLAFAITHLIFTSALQLSTTSTNLLSDIISRDSIVRNNSAYDVIIVGGGSAGCVLAERLSEADSWSVLLIEAGSYPPLQSRTPILANSLYGTKYDWNYYSENDGVNSQGIENGKTIWNRGKMLGGSSNINAMIYVRGNSYDYQRWYDEGNTDWHPNIVAKYFKKAESLQDQKLLSDPEVSDFYGHNGPLVINTFNNTYRHITEKVLKSWDEIGMKTVKDLNVANNFGSGLFRATAADGQRISTDYAYVNPVRSRDNLYVITDTLVTKVLINESTNDAYGVEVERMGVKKLFFAKKEVILSAGTINTPQIMMLSGIGPKTELESKAIKCIVDSPAVGQYLKDHIKIPVTIYGKEPSDSDPLFRGYDVVDYLYNRSGYLSQGSVDGIAFYSQSKEAQYPEFQNHFGIISKNSPLVINFVFAQGQGFKKPLVDSIIEQNKNRTLFGFFFNLLHPYSYGAIKLRSSDPKDSPFIYPNFFNDSRDLTATVNGIKILTKIVDTAYFREIGGFLGRLNWPPCNDYELDSFDYWKCICVNVVTTVYHPIGTARMGNNTTTSVVSSELKVHNVKKLRVIDASVMPSLISGNINGPVIMVAERAADLIKEEYGII